MDQFAVQVGPNVHKERFHIQRVETIAPRKLQGRGEVLKRARGNVWLTLGEYFVVDVQSNAVVSHHVDIEDHAREIGALAAWECLSKPSEN